MVTGVGVSLFAEVGFYPLNNHHCNFNLLFTLPHTCTHTHTCVCTHTTHTHTHTHTLISTYMLISTHVANTCGDPGTPSNGKKVGSDYSVGSQVTYVCNAGFTLRGDRTRQCQSGGIWSGTLPSCEGGCM